MSYNPNELSPFLVGVPAVFLITQVRVVNGVQVESLVADSSRAWGRLNPSYRLNQTKEGDLFVASVIRISPLLTGFDHIADF